MLIGFNTNVTYKGKIYHVQTEDSGLGNPVIVTHLYYQGAILNSKKTNYANIIGDPDFKEQLRAMMQQQHKEMIRELLGGKLTAEGHTAISGEEAQRQTDEKDEAWTDSGRVKERSLDEILLEHIAKKAKKGGNSGGFQRVG